MKYYVDFREYNSFSNALKLSLQLLALNKDYHLLFNDTLPIYLNNFNQSKTIEEDDYLLTTNKSDHKNKILLVFDEIDSNIINTFDNVTCFNNKIKQNIKKYYPNIKFTDIQLPLLGFTGNSIENVIAVTESEEDSVFMINLVNSFFKQSKIKFYVIGSTQAQLENVCLIEPNLKNILSFSKSFLINLSFKTGFSTLLNYFRFQNCPVASIEHPNIKSIFSDDLIYFQANIKSVYILLDFIFKKQLSSAPVPTPAPTPKNNGEFIQLIFQAYNIKDDKRKNEIENAIEYNLTNKYVENITCLLEDKNIKFKDSIMNNKKIKFVSIGKWVTYADIISYVNLHLNNQYVGLINIDIGLNHTSNWPEIRKYLDSKQILALSRHEYVDNNAFLDDSFSNLYHCHTQDGWFFKTPINVKEVDFEIGLLGCDNAFAHRLYVSGYMTLNLMSTFKLLHFDNVRGKNGKNFMEHQEDIKKIINQHPEKKGYRLLPSYEKMKEMSFDDVLNKFNVSEIDRYNILCDILSKVINIKN